MAIYEHNGHDTLVEDDEQHFMPVENKTVERAWHTTENGYGVVYILFTDQTKLRVEASGYATWIDIKYGF